MFRRKLLRLSAAAANFNYCPKPSFGLLLLSWGSNNHVEIQQEEMVVRIKWL